jgi:hypothetical protein
MEFHLLDLLFWVIGVLLIFKIYGYKETDIFFSIYLSFWFSLIWLIMFVIIDFNVSDIFNLPFINLKIKW